jgi:hypothetical protein
MCPALRIAFTLPESENETVEFQLSWSGISPDFKSVFVGAILFSQEEKIISIVNDINNIKNRIMLYFFSKL